MSERSAKLTAINRKGFIRLSGNSPNKEAPVQLRAEGARTTSLRLTGLP